MIEVCDGRHFFRVHHGNAPGVDFFGAIYRDPEKPPVFHYRFRYHVDRQHFDSADYKSWTCVTSPPEKTVEEFLGIIDSMFVPMLTAYGFTMGTIEVNSDDTQVVTAALLQVPGSDSRYEDS